jgi:S-(hydroxymethyl)glutathione dehydrogenase/alcohol dehydrogenase
VCREFGTDLSIEELSLAPPGPSDVEVELGACAICHSDIHFADGAWGGTLPAVYGHEAAGTVVAAGSSVESVAVGDRVVVTLIRSCGDCHQCAAGREVFCETEFDLDRVGPLTDDGAEVHQAMRTGAFAERVVVHHSQVAAIPPAMSFETASLLACGVLTGVGAVLNDSSVSHGSSVVVVGAGGVGLNAVQGARLAGAAVVIAVDVVDDKLVAAQGLGATHGFRADQDDLASLVQQATDGRGADHVFVTVGSATAVESAFDLVARGGEIIVVGMTATGVTAALDPASLAANGVRLIGSKMGSAVVSRDIPLLVAAHGDGRLQLDGLVTSTYALDDINEAIGEVKAGRALRNIIVFGPGESA